MPLSPYSVPLYSTQQGSKEDGCVNYDVIESRDSLSQNEPRYSNIVWLNYVATCSLIRRIQNRSRRNPVRGRIGFPNKIQ